jgi:NAD(P)-dependent dehydrogenase (short-subunit alcohol dehydrogenase family)
MKEKTKPAWRLDGQVVIVTGGAGLLGTMHSEAIAEAGGIPVLMDVRGEDAQMTAARIAREFGVPAKGIQASVTERRSLESACEAIVKDFGKIDVLINNAAIDPKVQAGGHVSGSRFEFFDRDQWDLEISVGLTGAMLCSQVFGSLMAARGSGAIVNIASDLGLIAPDQRIYRKPGLAEDEQAVKPVTYSVIKHGLVGLTRYLATYWADRNIRVNAFAPGGVRTNQPDEFVTKLSSLIPMGRMARIDEYKGAIVFLASDASSYMTGAILVMDGGRSCW